MEISTLRFGKIKIEPDHVIHFKDGLVGFTNIKDFVLLESSTMPLIMWLQSIEHPEIALPVTEPWFFKKDYNPHLNVSDKISLGKGDKDQIKTLVVLTIPQEVQHMTVNLKAPIMINVTKGKAAQIILQDKELNVKHPAHKEYMKTFGQLKVNQNSTSVNTTSEVMWNSVNYQIVFQDNLIDTKD